MTLGVEMITLTTVGVACTKHSGFLSSTDSNITQPCSNCSKVEGDSKGTTCRGPLKQPPNTIEYKVKADDKLTSLAALYDTTPSALKKLNKLSLDFLYPDQTLYLPVTTDGLEHDASHTRARHLSDTHSVLTASSSDVNTDSDFYSGSSFEEERPDEFHKYGDGIRPEEKKVSMRKLSNGSCKLYSSSQCVLLDEQCPVNTYVRLPSDYVIPGKDNVVKGTLIVTPNTVTFDPYVSDPLVLKEGVEQFTFVTQMSNIISAAIYRDSQAMKDLHMCRLDPTVRRPKIYHIEDCQLRQAQQVSVESNNSYNESTLSCSCGGDEAFESENCGAETVFDAHTREEGTDMSLKLDDKQVFDGEPSTNKAEDQLDTNEQTNSNDMGDNSYQVSNSKTNVAIYIHSCISREEKSELFKPISDLLSNQSTASSSCQPFYLCLQVGVKHDLRLSSSVKIYKETFKQPEYWFTVPTNLVDSLYKFFIEWRPEVYGEEITDRTVLSSRGFIAIPDAGTSSSVSTSLPRSPMIRHLSHTKVVKDWEIVSVDEIVRRKSLLDIEKYLPFPDMKSESLLMSEQDIKQLAALLPARVEGHEWSLVYSNEDHGYSLHTLYRNTYGSDSPSILVVQDSNGGVFGAFLSSSIHLSGHFYGNGECFLFTFVDGFKTYNWTGKNLFCMRGGTQGVTIGTGSATCGLWLDECLYHGLTQHCDTFDNDPLTGENEDFIVKAVEVWSLNDIEFY